jgi:hypothetical protein
LHPPTPSGVISFENMKAASLPPSQVSLPGDFTGADLTPDRYVVELEAPVRRELSRLAAHATSGTIDARGVRAALEEATVRTKCILAGGYGVVLLRGVPTEGLEREVAVALFTAMGEALGEPTAQTLDGELVTDIRDTGADRNDPDLRLYRTSAEQDFHTDGADVIGLMCLHPAESGGVSRVVSSVRVARRIGEARPDLAPLLFEPWFLHLPGGRERGLPGAFSRPIATFDGAKLESFFIGWYIRRAESVPDVPPLDDARRELLALYEATANDPELFVDMSFRPGDVQWLRNAFVLHKRTEYVDPAPPAPRRHLLRLWLSAPYLADTTPRFSAQELGR